jgi:hypothetical protein
VPQVINGAFTVLTPIPILVVDAIIQLRIVVQLVLSVDLPDLRVESNDASRLQEHLNLLSLTFY